MIINDRLCMWHEEKKTSNLEKATPTKKTKLQPDPTFGVVTTNAYSVHE